MTLSSRSMLIGFLVSLGLAASACTQAADETVAAKVEVLGSVSSATMASRVDEIEAINGQYQHCQGRWGQPWSIAVSGAPQLAYPVLSVVKNDSMCTLQVTEIVAGGTTYAATPNLALTIGYGASPSSFKATPQDATAFYGNANIDTLNFATNFTIRVLVSESPSDAWSPKQSAYTAQSSTVEASSVPAPDYSVGMTALTLQTDANRFVTEASGYAQLSPGITAAQSYAISDQEVGPWDSLDTVAMTWENASVKGNVADLEDLQLSAAQLALTGVQLPASRTLMMRNTQDGVISYQLIRMFFYPPMF